MDIAAQVRLIRTAKGETLAQVAEGTGLSLSYLSDIERGRTNPSIETLQRIADYHGLGLEVSFVGKIPNTVTVPRKDLEAMANIVSRMIENAE